MEGTALDTRRPSQRWKTPPPGTPFRHPHSEPHRPARAHAVGPVLGPTPASTAPGTRGSQNPGCTLRRTSGRGRDSAWHQAPLTTVEGTPPGDALPPPPQRATPARKGTRCGAGAGSTRPHRPHPGHAGRRTLAARSGGRAAEGGTAPDTRRPSQRWKAAPPGDALPPPPQRTTPARKCARRGAGTGSTRPHRPHPGHTGRGTLAARSGGRAAGEGTAPDTRRPSQRWSAPPPGTPFRHPHSEQCRPARAHAVGPVLGPHARIDRARDTRVAEPWPCTLRRTSAAGGRTAPDTRRPTQRWKAPLPGTPFRHPHSEQRRPARAHAVGPVLGPHARIDRTRDTRVAEPWLHAPEDERPGKGQRLTPGAPHNGGRHSPRGRPSANPNSEQRRPAGAHAVGPVLGPHVHIDRTRDTRVAEPWLPAPEDGRPGEGQRLTPDASRNTGRRPRGDAHPPPPHRATHQRTNAPATGHPHPAPCS